MRIAFLITRADDLGGAQVHVRDLSQTLSRAGHEVLVITGPPGVLTDELEKSGVTCRSVSELDRAIHPLRDARALWTIRKILREDCPDLLSTHSSKAGVLGRVAAVTLGIPTLFTAHGWAFARGKPWHLKVMYRNLERLAAPLAARIVTVSDADRELAVREGVARSDKVVTIRNAMPDIPSELRADPSMRPTRLTCVARMAPQKDHDTLLRALSGLLDLDWHLDLIGDGKRDDEIRALSSKLGLASRISFLGFCPNVAARLAESQLFVLPTHWEGLPRSIIEAMRAGLPVVATDVGGVKELVVEGKTGFLVERKDVEQLRSRLRSLIADESLRDRLGGAARQRYEDHFTYDRLVEDCLGLYSDVLAEAGSGGAEGLREQEG